MTYMYDWFGAPKDICITCPRCQKEAQFQFASVSYVEKKQHRAFFEQHPAFETALLYDAHAYKHKFCAIFYPALHTHPEQYLAEIPTDVRGLNWSTSWLLPKHGVVRCSFCLSKLKYQLNWPQDAYYQIEYKGQVLWAFHRDAFVSMYDYIQSKLRDRKKSGHIIYLLHIPSHFLTQHARAEIIKKMYRVLT